MVDRWTGLTCSASTRWGEYARLANRWHSPESPPFGGVGAGRGGGRCPAVPAAGSCPSRWVQVTLRFGRRLPVEFHSPRLQGRSLQRERGAGRFGLPGAKDGILRKAHRELGGQS